MLGRQEANAITVRVGLKCQNGVSTFQTSPLGGLNSTSHRVYDRRAADQLNDPHPSG